MKWEEIKKANEGLKKTDVKGKDYIEVNQRVLAFRSVCPGGSIQTDIISIENGVVVMQAKVYDESGNLLATGLAYEKEQASFINKTSYIENCETSAVGRALGLCGFGIDSSLASAEEVANAIHQQNQNSNKKEPAKKHDDKTILRNQALAVAKELGISPQQLAEEFKLDASTTVARFEAVVEELQKRKEDLINE